MKMWLVLKLQNTPKKEIRWTWIQSWTHKKQSSESSKPLLHVTIHVCLCWPFQSENCPWSPLNNVYQLYMYVVQYLLHSVLDIHVHFQKISTHVIVCLTMWSLCSWIVMFELHTAWLCNCITYQLLCSAVTFFLSSLSHVSLLGISINLSMIPCKLVISSVLLPIYLTLSVS